MKYGCSNLNVLFPNRNQQIQFMCVLKATNSLKEFENNGSQNSRTDRGKSVLSVKSVLRLFKFSFSHWASSKCVSISLIYSDFCLRACTYTFVCVRAHGSGCSGQLVTCRAQLRQKKVSLSLLLCSYISVPFLFSFFFFFTPSVSFSCDGNTL